MIFDWIIKNWVELFGAITGLLYIYFSIKENILLWPIGILTSVTYIYVFYVSKFYADMSLQFYYLFISFYGWVLWKKNKKNVKKQEFKIKRTSNLKLLVINIFNIIFTIIIWQILKNFTDSPVPFWDAFTTGLSIVATWMITQKLIEHWFFWVIVNFVSIILYIQKGLYPTVILFCVYLILAFVGFYQWKKIMLSESD